jgi:hypothetical protein
MTLARLNPEVIEEIINYHNKELPKDPNARIDDLLLVSNSISKAVETHLGTLTVVIGYGSYGTGKTWTSYKIFHELKNRAYVTYIPIRVYKNVIGSSNKCVRNSKGEVSLVGTIIAEALVKPMSLKQTVGEVLTNAPDLQGIAICGRTIEEVINDYHAYLVKNIESYPYHVILLDEFDAGIETLADIEAIVDAVQILRSMIDRYGRSRVAIVALMAPIPSQSLGREWADIPIYKVVIDRLKSRVITTSGPYEAVALLGLDLGTQQSARTMLIEFIKKAVEIINKKLGTHISVSESETEDAVDILVRIWPTMRWCRDVTVKGLAKAISEALNNGITQVNILNYIYDAIKDLLALDDISYVEKILIRKAWGSMFKDIEIDRLGRLKGFCEEILKAACPDCEFYKYSYREERGFVSLFYRIQRVVKKERKHEVEIKSVDVAFWLRLSDITDESISKASKIFAKVKYVVPIIPSNIKIGSPIEKMITPITLTPIEMYYLLTATSKAINAKLQEHLEGVLRERVQEHAPKLGRILGGELA